jgi:hypothetical protein
MFQVKKLRRVCLRNPVKVLFFFSFFFLGQFSILVMTCNNCQLLFQIEVADKYSTVDTLEQHFCFMPIKCKVFPFLSIELLSKTLYSIIDMYAEL